VNGRVKLITLAKQAGTAESSD